MSYGNTAVLTISSGMRPDEMDSTQSSRSFSRVIEQLDGIILSMNLKNFFCHENLEINFNNNINFIIGRNGSGKSAILTALVVGLGARATVTNRGSNLQSFVRKGSNSAMIEIKIKNSSQNAYKHNIYGDIITIIRTINSSGGSAYKIKNKNGEVVSSKREDVQLICSALDIQVDNPICVLNQDDARNFHASDSKRKYILYKKATNIDIIENNYIKSLNNCKKAKSILDRKCEAFSELTKELQQLKHKYEQLQSKDDIEKEKEKLQDEYFWSEIVEFEDELQRLMKNHQRQEKQIGSNLQKLELFKQKKINHENSCREIKEKLEMLKNEDAENNNKLKDHISKFQESKKNWKLQLHNLQKKKEHIHREKGKITDLSNEVENATKINLVEETKKIHSERNEIEKRIEEYCSRIDTLNHELSQIRQATVHNQKNYDDAMHSENKILNDIRHVNSQLQELNIRGKDNLAVYGTNMVNLVNAVKKAYNNKKFTEMPRGPIGYYLKVRDKNWTSALEHIIGNALLAFCVNNERDFHTLSGIMDQIYGKNAKPSITTSLFIHKVHDVSKNCVVPPAGYHSALNYLQIDDPIIENYLIDNLAMETILMVATHEESSKFASQDAYVPRNCSKIVTLDCTEYYPRPNYRCYGSKAKPSRYLQVNMVDKKRQLDERLVYLQNNFNKIKNELQDMNNSKRQLCTQEKSADQNLRQLIISNENLKEKLSRLNTNLQNMEGGHIKVLAEELSVAKKRVQELQLEENSLAKEENSMRNSTKEMETHINQLKSEKERISSEYLKSKEELDQIKIYLERNMSDIKMTENILNEEGENMENVKSNISIKQDLIEKKTESAKKLCPRIENPRKKDIIISNIKKIEARLKSINKSGPSKQEIAVQLIQKEKLHVSNHMILTNLHNIIELLKVTTKQHYESITQVQSFIASRVKFCFQSILNIRGYTGSMDINNDEQKLEIHCTGRDSASIRSADSTSSLSGGERSYATVALIMALWDCMELPFYFLDEFDVFMDNVNRKITMDLLVSHANENLTRQYVFFTPQDTSALTSSNTITIHKLEDPIKKK